MLQFRAGRGGASDYNSCTLPQRAGSTNRVTISGRHTKDDKSQPRRALRAAQLVVCDTDTRVGSDGRPGSASAYLSPSLGSSRTPALRCFAPVAQVKPGKRTRRHTGAAPLQVSNLAHAAFHTCRRRSAAELIRKCGSSFITGVK